jgi:hypothetical protein
MDAPQTNPTAEGAGPNRPTVSAIFWPLAAAIVILGTLLARTPPPEYFLGDSDGGVYIAGGWELLSSGRSPQIDFLSSYGPLSFQLRAASFALIGPRMLAETLLVTLGYLAGYMFLFELACARSRNRVVGFLILLGALLAFPRYYKFPVLLFPLLTLAATMTYLRRPQRRGAVWLGLSVGLATLFRHDFGFCSGVCVLLALVWGGRSTQDRRRIDVAIALIAALIPFAVWFATQRRFVAAGHLVRELVEVTATLGAGLSLPHPLLTWSAPNESLLFLAFYLVPFALIWRLWQRRATVSRSEAGEQVCIAVMTTLVLGQSMHRSDLGHLLQAIGPAWIALASLWPDASPGSPRIVSAGRVAIPVLLAGLLVVTGVRARWFELATPAEVIGRWRAASTDRVAMRDAVLGAHPESIQGAAAAFLTSATEPSESVAVFPCQPQVPFFSGRAFAGDTLLVAPGFFAAPPYQARMIAALHRDQPAVVLWDLDFDFDHQPDRASARTHSLLLAYVRSAMVATGSTGPYTVFRRRPGSRSSP